MNKQFYLSVWRWHFFAGLYVVPFILMLSLTGLLMLVSPWIDAWQYGDDLIQVEVPVESVSVGKISADVQLAKVKLAYPHLTAAQYIPPINSEQSSIFKMRGDNFATLLVFVNPYSGEVLGDFDGADRWYSIADDIHGTLMIGQIGDALIELSAGLMIFLLLSGLYLHWPRNGANVKAMLLPLFLLPHNLRILFNREKTSRSIWKEIHSSLGFYLTLFILFFALTGMAWTGIWGQQLVQPYGSFPLEKKASAWRSDITHSNLNDGQLNEMPWNLEQVPLPKSTVSNSSTPNSTTPNHANLSSVSSNRVVGLEQIVEQGLQLGFQLSEGNRFRIALPLDPVGVYTLMSIASSHDVINPMGDRTLHIDQYSSEVLADIRWQDYNLGAKAMALGIALHKGTLGLWNIVLASIVCLLLILLSVSGIILWWRRKPKGEMAAPAAGALEQISASAKALVLITILLGLCFPVTGAVMVVFALYECRFLYKKQAAI
ncbi:MAG: PepSY domain-containing protein [Oleispira sp.]|nr:PepSY domain-containing protein [Oleispira sp.]